MTIADTGAPWTLADARAVGRADWVQVGALTRADFPADVLAALARDRRVALDGQALVRPARTGPLVLDADFDPAVLRHVTALKLSEEEVDGARRRGARRRARRAGAAAHPRIDGRVSWSRVAAASASRSAASSPRTRPAPATPSSPATSGRARPATGRRRPRATPPRPPRECSSWLS